MAEQEIQADMGVADDRQGCRAGPRADRQAGVQVSQRATEGQARAMAS
jgi:arginase family enzyme